MKNKKEVLGIVFLLLAIIISFFLDKQIIEFIQGFRSTSLDYFFLSITFASNVFIIFFLLTTLFLWKENKRRWIIPLWLASLLSAIVSFILKITIKRPRPFQQGTISLLTAVFIEMSDSFNIWNFSFPSFQAMLAFSAIPIIRKEFRKFSYFWIVFAVLIAFSRVYFGVHYLSDVIIGSAIGYFIGIGIVRAEEKYKIGRRIIKKLRIIKK